MRDMTIVMNKKIVNKDSGEVRFVTKIDEENRKIYSVPVDLRDAEPTVMAAASYDRRWKLYEEPAAEETKPAEPETTTEETKPAEPETTAEETKPAEPETPVEETKPADEDKPNKIVESFVERVEAQKKAEEKPVNDPMEMGKTITALESIFDKLNVIYFEGKLPRPVITVQTTPKAYGHCTTKKIWKTGEENGEAMYEINLGAEFINRPKEQTCCTLLHEMVHLYCTENDITDTCQHGRYHNKTFKAECEARDMTVEYDRANGYAHTAPTDAFKAKLEEAGVDLTVRFARIMPKAKKKAEREKAHKYVCACCGQEVRTTSELSLICGVCEVPMGRED
ncbi:MAG: SprT-like domain-containing protein [Synergistaceae bacterium]|nr:SprT-like domain-containing protein [Synergistaceae bacterium]